MQFQWFFVPEVGHDFSLSGLQQGTKDQAVAFVGRELNMAWAGVDRQHYIEIFIASQAALTQFESGTASGAVIYVEYGSWVICP